MVPGPGENDGEEQRAHDAENVNSTPPASVEHDLAATARSEAPNPASGNPERGVSEKLVWMTRPAVWIAGGAVAIALVVVLVVSSSIAAQNRDREAQERLLAAQQAEEEESAKAQPDPAPTPEPTREVAPVVPENSFAGPITVTDVDGYTFTLDFQVTPSGPAEIDLSHDKPGFSTITQLVRTSPVTLTNTTPGRNLSFGLAPGTTFPVSAPRIQIGALYAIDSPVCVAGVTNVAKSKSSHCYLVATSSYVAHSSPSEAEFAPDQSRELRTFGGVSNKGNYFSVTAVPDAQRDQVQAALSKPAGWVVLYTGHKASLRFPDQTCGTSDTKSWVTGAQVFGLTVLGASEPTLGCTGQVNWPHARSAA